jgi:hypothetical protein
VIVLVKYKCCSCNNNCVKRKLIRDIVRSLGLDHCSVSCNYSSYHTEPGWAGKLSDTEANIIVVNKLFPLPNSNEDPNVLAVRKVHYQRVNDQDWNVTVFIVPEVEI